MAVACDACGEKTNEIKTGGEIAPKGKKITLHITGPDDLNRDLLKVSCVSFYSFCYLFGSTLFIYLCMNNFFFF